MKIKFNMFFLLLAMGISSLAAGPLRDEYYQVRKEVNDAENSGDQEARKTQLEETLTRSLRLVMLRRYQYSDYDKIKPGDFEYEESEINKYTYFIKFKGYVGYFSFSSDPAEYYSMPKDYRMYQKPSGSAAASASDSSNTNLEN